MATFADLRPTAEQLTAFASYLPNAHSWYKHIPLLPGRQFVVFVAPDAAVGRLVARLNHPDPRQATGYELIPGPEGPEFTDEHPRIHYGWRTTKEYRQRFGYLDYMRRYAADDPYTRDAGAPVQLPADLEARCSFVLYPYVHGRFVEAVAWDVHSEAIEQLRSGASHPGRDAVLELRRLAEVREALWSKLSDRDQEAVIAHRVNDSQPLTEPVSDDVAQYHALGVEVGAVYSVLRQQEVGKIQFALAELDSWLREGK